jgi:hypothetical protein
VTQRLVDIVDHEDVEHETYQLIHAEASAATMWPSQPMHALETEFLDPLGALGALSLQPFPLYELHVDVQRALALEMLPAPSMMEVAFIGGALLLTFDRPPTSIEDVAIITEGIQGIQ